LSRYHITQVAFQHTYKLAQQQVMSKFSKAHREKTVSHAPSIMMMNLN
jgi:hypothetical protein